VLVARDLVPAPVDDEGRALLQPRVDVRHDLVAVRGRDQRPHVGGTVLRLIDLEVLHALRENGNQLVGRVADRDRDGDRHAALASRTVGRA
jgi:hypothetical protein